MCRMICCLRREGKIPEELVEEFGNLALKGKRGPHGDGTGALLCLEGSPIIFKSLIPAWEAKIYLRELIVELDPSLCIFHARKASKELQRISKRAVSISLVHPQSSGPWHVFHNGTLKSTIKEVRPGEYSDTAGVAEILEREGLGGLIEVLKREGKGSNFFIYNEEEGALYVVHSSPKEGSNDQKEYYELYAGKGKLTVISSEKGKYSPKRATEVLEVEFEDPEGNVWTYSQQIPKSKI